MLTGKILDNIFDGEIVGKDIVFLESTTSTNDEAFNIARQRSSPDGIVVVADMQTNGRGRLGRRWISPPWVNLYFSVLMNAPKDPSLITLASAVAVASVIRDHTGLKAEIKWPNDIYISGKKTAGILVEMKSCGRKNKLLAVGIGINVNMSLDAVDEEIRDATTSLKIEKGEPLDRAELLKKLLAALDEIYKILLNGHKRDIINNWIALNCTIGKHVTVRNHDEVISGTAEDINDSGELIVRLSEGDIQIVRAGEVTLKN